MVIEVQSIKILRMLILVTTFLAIFLSAPNANAAQPVSVMVEGELVQADVPPVIVNDHMLVSVRFVSEALGATVSWNPAEQQVTVAQGADTIVLTLGKTEALVNGTAVTLEVAAQLVNDRTMVPVRFIAEALGATVEWDDSTRTVSIARHLTAITGMAYIRDTGSSRVILTFNDPVLSVEPEQEQGLLILVVPSAEIQLAEPARAIYDSLLKTLHLEQDGRDVRLIANTWHPPVYRYELSTDGRQLVVELEHTVTGIRFHRDGQIPMVSISATGQLNYTSFTLREPNRLVIDLPRAHMGPRVEPNQETGDVRLPRVRSAAHKGDFEGVRVVLELADAVPHEIISTEMGLQIRFVPRLTEFSVTQLGGKTRLTFAGSLPMQSVVQLSRDRRELTIQVPQTRTELATREFAVNDGTVDSVTVLPDERKDGTTIRIDLPYYIDHNVVSNGQSGQIVLDIVTSSVYGKRIWVDAGHGKIPGGKDDPGTVGETYGTFEKDVNLLVALALQQKLEAAGAVVFMTRTDDVGIDFRDRPAEVNSLMPAVDLFVSIHHNAATKISTRGTETYYWPVNPRSRAAAEAIHAAVLNTLGFPDRQVRREAFYVISEITVPAVLVELGYLSNAEEERLIAEPGLPARTYPTKAAEGIHSGIVDFFWQEIPRPVAN